MRTLVLGDTHGRSFWKLIVNTEKHDRVIFVGDYFDSFHIKTDEQVNNFLDIIEYKKSSGKEVILLIGNHDTHYFTSIGNCGISGYQGIGKLMIEPVIEANKEHLQMAYQMDELLFTHAGVSSVFMNDVFGVDGWKVENIANDLNELFKYKPNTFRFVQPPFSYSDSSGDNVYQTPIWIRPRSLMKANSDTLRKKIIQVVGHTYQNQIDVLGKATGCRYFFIDTLGTSGEYLIIEDKCITTGNFR
jgi:predicted MPP superfamily phosphohydrolase